MKITVQKSEGSVLAAFEGRYDNDGATEVQGSIDEIVKLASAGNRVSMDFSGVDFISSPALKQIVAICEASGENKVEVTGMSKYVLDVMQLSGFDKILTIL